MKLLFRLSLIALLLAISACRHKNVYEWHQVDSVEGHFSVLLPGTPFKTEHGYGSRASATAGFLCSSLPNPSVTPQSLDEFLDRARDSGIRGIGGNILSEKRFTFQGFPARDIVAVTNDRSRSAAFDNRLVYANERLYTLMVSGMNGAHDQANIEKFFNSLVIR